MSFLCSLVLNKNKIRLCCFIKKIIIINKFTYIFDDKKDDSSEKLYFFYLLDEYTGSFGKVSKNVKVTTVYKIYCVARYVKPQESSYKTHSHDLRDSIHTNKYQGLTTKYIGY